MGFLLAHNTILNRTHVIVESMDEDGRGDLAPTMLSEPRFSGEEVAFRRVLLQRKA